MKRKYTLFFLLLLITISSTAQEWQICATPAFENRVDDLFMVNGELGYAVCGDGRIVKSINGGSNWYQIARDTAVYCRSVEFVNPLKGFVGGFPNNSAATNILRRTVDGGASWTDLTPLLHPRAKEGICGLAAPDPNTIYGCGNWYNDSAYIVRSADGGDSWDFIDMSAYASSLIDMHFTSRDTGFVTGRGVNPQRKSVILYTTDGGQTWEYKFQSPTSNEYCWKIQHLTDSVYFASIEDFSPSVTPKILKSTNGGMTWTPHVLSTANYNVEGVGFIDSLHGWAGGDFEYTFESFDGGLTWNFLYDICPGMNRVFRINDSLLFASGNGIWKYGHVPSIGLKEMVKETRYAALSCSPNPASDLLEIKVGLSLHTRLLLVLLDQTGREVKRIENAYKQLGDLAYKIDVSQLPAGTYYLALKTHEDKIISKVIIDH
ncbi:MAG: YCF48-related protein [Bacteroidota bacterium]